MRHRKAGLKLNRTPSHRNAMFRNMVTSLFKYDRIRTTAPKAMELRRWADHIVTLAKRGDLHARRQALAIVREKDVVHKLFENAAERFGEISGGYTRVIKLGRRPGDAAPVSLIELVVLQDTKKKKTKKKKTKTEAAPKKAAADKKAADKEPEKPKKVAKEKAVPADKEEAAKGEKPAAQTAPKNEAAAIKEDKADVKEEETAKEKSAESKKEDTVEKETQTDAADNENASDTQKTTKDDE
jgi:large subunit ribosomal protein L17